MCQHSKSLFLTDAFVQSVIEVCILSLDMFSKFAAFNKITVTIAVQIKSDVNNILMHDP